MSATMRVVTSHEVSATAAIRFRNQYRHWAPDDRFADGKTKADVDLMFNTGAHSPERISNALKKTWAYPQCACCSEFVNAAVRLREEWSEKEFDFCAKCLTMALGMLNVTGCAVEVKP